MLNLQGMLKAPATAQNPPRKLEAQQDDAALREAAAFYEAAVKIEAMERGAKP